MADEKKEIQKSEEKWYVRLWSGVRAWCYKYIGGLFMDEKAGKLTVSLGRVTILLVLFQMMWVWRRTVIDGEPGAELPDGMLEVFLVLAGYVFGSKAVAALHTKWKNGKERTLTAGEDPEK